MLQDALDLRRPARLLGLLLVPGIVLACGGSDGGGEETTGPAENASASATIQMTSSSSGYGSGTSYDFSPRVDTVSVGDTVAWSNGTSATHDVSADDGSWDLGDVTANGSEVRVFSETGEHPYHCTYHGSPGSGMHGTIVVEQ